MNLYEHQQRYLNSLLGNAVKLCFFIQIVNQGLRGKYQDVKNISPIGSPEPNPNQIFKSPPKSPISPISAAQRLNVRVKKDKPRDSFANAIRNNIY